MVKKLLLIPILLVALGATLQQSVMAQVVNAGAGSSSSNSQITMTTTIPSVVIVKVNQGTSTLSATVNPGLIDSASNVTSQDFRVQGNIVVNSPGANVQCTVSTTALSLSNGTDTVTVNLSGTIGGTNISTSGFTPTFINRQAAINIVGDLDETTVTSQKSPGTYTGTYTITSSLL